MRFLTANRTPKAVNVPYTYHAETVTKWDYVDHAMLGYAIVSADTLYDADFESIDLGEHREYVECLRQSAVLAVNRNPTLFFASAAQKIARYMEEGEDTDPHVKARVSRALEQADEMVQAYFNEEEHLPEAEGRGLVKELIEDQLERRKRKLKQNSFIQ